MKKLFIGTSGYNYKDWKGSFYPENLPQKEWLSYYSDLELKIWAEKIRQYLKKVDVYCYFNNDIQGFAVKNAMTLREILLRDYLQKNGVASPSASSGSQ